MVWCPLNVAPQLKLGHSYQRFLKHGASSVVVRIRSLSRQHGHFMAAAVLGKSCQEAGQLCRLGLGFQVRTSFS